MAEIIGSHWRDSSPKICVHIDAIVYTDILCLKITVIIIVWPFLMFLVGVLTCLKPPDTSHFP